MPKCNPEKLTKVRIEVTERLVKRGTPGDCTKCPFALALRKVLAKNVEIDADYNTIFFVLNDSMEYQCITTPATVANFMEKIDAELTPLPKPFAINLKIKNKFLRPSLRA